MCTNVPVRPTHFKKKLENAVNILVKARQKPSVPLHSRSAFTCDSDPCSMVVRDGLEANYGCTH